VNRENQSNEIYFDLLKTAEKQARYHTYYEMLGIPEGANENHLKNSLRLLKQNHPDWVKTSPEKYHAIQVLSDPVKRKQYDASLARQQSENPQTSNRPWVDQWGSERWSGNPKDTKFTPQKSSTPIDELYKDTPIQKEDIEKLKTHGILTVEQLIEMTPDQLIPVLGWDGVVERVADSVDVYYGRQMGM
jgi:DnaJ-domain-containing protein 1